MVLFKAFLQSVSMYSILPVPGLKWDSRADRHMLSLYPAVGILLGALWYAGVWLVHWLHVPALLSAAFTAVLPFLLTGFLHLDGFMDVNDAVLSRRDRERRLEILRDSHCGAFAVLSVIVLILFQFAAASAVLEQPPRMWLSLVCLPVLSRGMTAFALLALPTLPGSSMAAWEKQDTTLVHRIVSLAFAAAAAIAMALLCGLTGIVAVLVCAAAFALAVFAAFRSLGGVSGDTSGYAMTVAETAGLVALACL